MLLKSTKYKENMRYITKSHSYRAYPTHFYLIEIDNECDVLREDFVIILGFFTFCTFFEESWRDPLSFLEIC